MHPLIARHRPFAALALGAVCLGAGCAAGQQAAGGDDAVAVTSGERASPTAIASERHPLTLSSRVENVMPRGLTTVGAATLGDALYLVGGYFGSPHEYSKEFQSGSVTRLDLSSGAWQELPSVEPIQSPAVTSDGRHLYKLGGMRALNAASTPRTCVPSQTQSASIPGRIAGSRYLRCPSLARPTRPWSSSIPCTSSAVGLFTVA